MLYYVDDMYAQISWVLHFDWLKLTS